MKLRSTVALLIVAAASAIATAQTRPATTPAAAPAATAPAGQVVITFEKYEIGKPVPSVTEKGVTFTLTTPLRNSTAQGRVMFFPHLNTDKKGILNAMANEQQDPLLLTFQAPANAVTLTLWGSTDVPALLEAYDKDKKLIDKTSLDKIPNRKNPADAEPSFQMTVKGEGIMYVLLSGPRTGEFLAAEEVRYTPSPAGSSAPAATSTAPAK